MKIEVERCIGCEACHPYCTMGAISIVEDEKKIKSFIAQDDCVECGVCLKANICPVDAIYMPDLNWPRTIRATFSNPLSEHKISGLGGRGTEEMKTNDVSGRYPWGIAGVGIEMGRPGIGATFKDIQVMSMGLARFGVEFEVDNPLTELMEDKKNGRFQEELLEEKILSAIMEFRVDISFLKTILLEIKYLSKQIDTVFSLNVITRVGEDGEIPSLCAIEGAGFSPRPNLKVNVGLGRPKKEE
jgi:Pyruvate/2-oxoacid:ferredoxin oxidoreductase delta subunit